MSIGILYESNEWSTFSLFEYLTRLLPKKKVRLYNLETDVNIEAILTHNLIVNRIYASAYFRGHKISLFNVKKILDLAKQNGKVILNSYEAHFYEIDKYLTSQVLRKHGLSVPEIYGCFKGKGNLKGITFAYPLIIKPNCGGRTKDTHLVYTEEQLKLIRRQLNPEIYYLAQAYLMPRGNFITRIEYIGGRPVQVLKKMLTVDGLATYNLGSKFYAYPECPVSVLEKAKLALELLKIEMGSLDIIESQNDSYIIDVNSVSNTSEDFVHAFNFDLMQETAKYIASKYYSLFQKEE